MTVVEDRARQFSDLTEGRRFLLTILPQHDEAPEVPVFGLEGSGLIGRQLVRLDVEGLISWEADDAIDEIQRLLSQDHPGFYVHVHLDDPPCTVVSFGVCPRLGLEG